MGRLKELLAGVGRGLRYIGFALIALGAVACVAPIASGLVLAVIIGLILLAAGALVGLVGWQAREAGKGNVVLIAGAVAGLSGLVLVVQPSAGLTVVRWVLMPWMLVSGVSEAALAFRLRPEEGWGETFGSAVVSIAAGLSLWSGWPIAGAQAVGLLVGSKLIASGWSVVRVQRTLTSAGDRLRAKVAGLAS